MENKEKNKNTGLKFTLIIFIIISLLLGGYIVYDKVLSNGEKNNIEINNNENNQKNEVEYNEEHILALGLSMYKYANGLDSLFYKVDDSNMINNYSQVAAFFTNEFITNAKKGGMCWPTEKDGLYYLNTDCLAGGTTTNTYKSISIKEYNETEISYVITIDENHTSMEDTEIKDDHKEIEQEFEIVLENNMWKINKFKYNGQAVHF